MKPHLVQQAEQSLLGSCLIDSDAIDAVSALIAEGDFVDGRHRRIWSAITRLYTASKPVDAVTVNAAMRGEPEGLDYLEALAGAVPSARNAKRYAELVREAAMGRAVLEAAQKALEAAQSEKSAKDKLDAIGALFEGLEGRSTRQPKHLASLLTGRMDAINALAEGVRTPGMRLRHPMLTQSHRGGLRPGSLTILAARPSVGKSSFAMDLLMGLAEDGRRGLFLSQEMPEEELADRAICNAAEVDGMAMGTARLTDDDWKRLTDGVERLADLPLWVDDQPALTLMDVRAKARQVKGLEVLVLDYLQLCSSTLTRESRTAQVGEISRGLKAMAKEMGIAVIALSQLNRDVEKRAGKRPQMSDLRDSGEIEQDADSVWFLWPLREASERDPWRRVGIDIAKNRSGSKRDGVLMFNGATQRWRESMEQVADFGKPQGGEL